MIVKAGGEVIELLLQRKKWEGLWRDILASQGKSYRSMLADVAISVHRDELTHEVLQRFVYLCLLRL